MVCSVSNTHEEVFTPMRKVIFFDKLIKQLIFITLALRPIAVRLIIATNIYIAYYENIFLTNYKETPQNHKANLKPKCES